MKIEVFKFQKISKEMREELDHRINNSVSKLRNQIIPVENAHKLLHGVYWKTYTDRSEAEESKMKTLEHTQELKFKDIIQRNEKSLAEYIQALIEGLHSTFMRSVFETISESTEKSGNKVSVKQEGSPSAAFLKMLETIEFGVGRDGKISMPEIHLSPESHQQFIEDFEKQGEEFREKVAQIKAVKADAAFKKEQERLGKYKE